MTNTFNIQRFFLLALFAFVVLLLSDPANAGSAAGLPWEGPLDKLKNSITGPVALAVSLIGIVVAGGMLIFGGELGEFARRIIMVVLVLSLLVAANNLLTTFYGAAGAVIHQPLMTHL